MSTLFKRILILALLVLYIILLLVFFRPHFQANCCGGLTGTDDNVSMVDNSVNNYPLASKWDTAGIFAGLYSLPGSVFRALGGWMSDKWGARFVMYLTFVVSLAVLFVMSYPQTSYTVQGIKGALDYDHLGPLVIRLQRTYLASAYLVEQWMRSVFPGSGCGFL